MTGFRGPQVHMAHPTPQPCWHSHLRAGPGRARRCRNGRRLPASAHRRRSLSASPPGYLDRHGSPDSGGARQGPSNQSTSQPVETDGPVLASHSCEDCASSVVMRENELSKNLDGAKRLLIQARTEAPLTRATSAVSLHDRLLHHAIAVVTDRHSLRTRDAPSERRRLKPTAL